jgi:hypothetical protein
MTSPDPYSNDSAESPSDETLGFVIAVTLLVLMVAAVGEEHVITAWASSTALVAVLSLSAVGRSVPARLRLPLVIACGTLGALLSFAVVTMALGAVWEEGLVTDISAEQAATAARVRRGGMLLGLVWLGPLLSLLATGGALLLHVTSAKSAWKKWQSRADVSRSV